jgi:hypothetical protein
MKQRETELRRRREIASPPVVPDTPESVDKEAA